ncbi:MAG: SGNH/GDSL hydrolase family protein [Fuerstiella sp.]
MKNQFLGTLLIVGCLSSSVAFAESPIQPGDRIAIIGNTFADQLRIHGYLETLLLQRYRDNPVSIRNLSWAGDMLAARDRPTGFASEESTLRAHKTDVIIACFGLGESFAGEEGLAEFKNQLNTLITSYSGKTYNGKTAVRMILVSPIACEDLGKLTPGREKRNQNLEAYTLAMQDVATATKIPFVNVFETSRYLMDESVGQNLTDNGIHLNAYGYWAMSHTFYEQLTAYEGVSNQQPWWLRIDAAKTASDARGVKISQLNNTADGLRFQVTEQSPPRLRPPTDQPLPAQLEVVRDTLVIENLPPGEYSLTIDERPVVTATAKDWAKGVAIDSSPAHKAVEAYQSVVNDKNLQFVYGWKALNQVHIVGERRSSPSGKRLPGEVIAFNKLANELDQTLRNSIELNTRTWKLLRTSK